MHLEPPIRSVSLHASRAEVVGAWRDIREEQISTHVVTSLDAR